MSIVNVSDDATMNEARAPVVYETKRNGEPSVRTNACPPKIDVTRAVAANMVPARDRRLSSIACASIARTDAS
jgi:hypothetical protein